jgi:hypothetical protein
MSEYISEVVMASVCPSGRNLGSPVEILQPETSNSNGYQKANVGHSHYESWARKSELENVGL